MTQFKDEYKPYRVGDAEWIYIHEEDPPRGVKLNILTEGGCAIQGHWMDRNGYIAFQKQFKRNKDKEAELYKWMEENGKEV